MKHILEKLTTILACIAALSAMIILLVTSININCFNRDFFSSEYKSLNTAKDLGMTDTDLSKATNTLLDYLQDKRNNINVQISIKGAETQAFNAKEASHMKDVKSLYHFALIARNVAIITFIGSVIYIFIRVKKNTCTILSINYMKTAILVAVFFAILAGWAFVDFDTFWTSFHKLAFRNNLWLLDPSTDLMINLFPSKFFSDLVFRIVGMFAGGFILLFLLSYLYLRKQLRKLHDAFHYET